MRIGVDLGGTKIEAVVVAGQDVAARRRIPTEQEKGYEHIVRATSGLVRALVTEGNLDLATVPIGVGMPGSTTRTGNVKNANTTCLNGRPFQADLMRDLGRVVHFANDANCFALAEATWGAGAEGRVVFGVILGTGVGGGLVFRGDDGRPRVWEGAQGIAGEWGHVALEPESGPLCYCGRRGCIETLLSGPAIEAAYTKRTGKRKKLAALAEENAEIVTERIALFGRAIATVINIVDPDVIVLGGGVSKIAALYDAGVRAAARWVFNDEMRTKIVRHELGDSAGVLGAALLE